MTYIYIYVTYCVSKFGAILFTPIRLTAVACNASGPLKVRLTYRSQNVPPSPPKPLHKHWYIYIYIYIYLDTSLTAHYSQLTNMVLTLLLAISLALEFTVGWNINTGLWSKNSFLTRKVVSGVLYPYNSDKINAQKSEMHTNINVYSYRRAHRSASYSAGVV